MADVSSSNHTSNNSTSNHTSPSSLSAQSVGRDSFTTGVIAGITVGFIVITMAVLGISLYRFLHNRQNSEISDSSAKHFTPANPEHPETLNWGEMQKLPGDFNQPELPVGEISELHASHLIEMPNIQAGLEVTP